MPSSTDLFTRINDVAASTPWLHAPMTAYASYGLLLFAALLGVGWWIARGRGDRTMATAVLAPIAAVVAITVQQPLITWAGHPRPFVVHPDALVLVSRSADASFPSDHACVAGAVTMALFVIDRRLGAVSGAAALLMAFSRVYVGAHWPADVLAGLAFGALVSLAIVLTLRTPVARLVHRGRRTRLAPLLGVAASSDADAVPAPA